MNAVQNKLFAFEPQTKGQEILHSHTVEQFNQMSDVRRQRIQAADTGIAPAMWYVVAIGVLITIALFWLFEMEPATQFILGGPMVRDAAHEIARCGWANERGSSP
jgi:hypothetical protein